MLIIDYLSVINPRQKPLSLEESQKIMDFVSNFRKKFGIVFDISSYRTNKSDEDDKD